MRAVVLNPILVDDDAVTIRWGAYFNEQVPLQSIRSIESTQPDIPKKECLDMGMMGSNPCWIILSEPMPIKNTFGKTRAVRAINVTPDNAADFKKIIVVGRIS
jgi:hypothetical protein